MLHVKNAQQKLYSIFMLALAAILLTACSDNSAAESKEEQQVEATKVQEKKEIKDETAEEKGSETESKAENQTTEKAKEEPAVSNIADETLTLDGFIKRWNEIEPGRLSGETETISVENGILTGSGNLGNSDSYVFELNQKENMIKKVSLNLTYPLPEEGEGLGKNIPHNISILMDVLEPKLSEEEKEKMLSTLLNSETQEVSVKEGEVTYTVSNGDDRFWLDASLNQ